MFKCGHCGYEFTYKESFNLRNGGAVGIVCPECENRNYFTAKSRKRGMLHGMLASIVILSLFVLNVPFLFIYPIAITFIIAYFLASPYLFELTDNEEPLW